MEWGIVLKCVGVLFFVLWAYPMGLYDFALPIKLKSPKGKAKIFNAQIVTAEGPVTVNMRAQVQFWESEAAKATAEGRNDEAALLRSAAAELRDELSKRQHQASRNLKRDWVYIVLGVGAYVLIIWGLAEIL